MRPLAARIAQLNGEGALAVFQRARELEASGRSIIHLELGEPDFHPSTPVIAAAKRAIEEGRDRYCASGGLAVLQEELATYLARTRRVSIDPGNVVVAPGCKIALFLAMMALIEEGDEVLYPEPGFPIYPSLTRALGGKAVAYELREENQLQADPAEIAAKITPRTKLLITNSPNNPTGTVYSDAVQKAIAELAVKHDLLVIADEIYARIVYGDEYRSIFRLPGMAERTLIVDGFSKTFAMTGWRLGYVVVPSRMVDAMNLLVVNSYTSVAEFTQVAAVEALRDIDGATGKMVSEYRRRREEFLGGLNRIAGFSCQAPEGAFYAWVNVKETGLSAEELCRRMLEEAGVAAIPGAAFGPSGKDFVRFSFASSGTLLQEATKRIAHLSSTWQMSKVHS